jgi:hypothetical protein
MTNHTNSQLWVAVQQFLSVGEKERVPGELFTPASIINGWANAGFGVPAFILTAVICLIVSGILMLSIVGWSLTTFNLWFAPAPVCPDCDLRSRFWDVVCVISSLYVGLRSGADIRRWVINTTKPEIGRFKTLLPPLIWHTLAAVIVTSALALATAYGYDMAETFPRLCAKVLTPF